jgi:hypothetical protein
MERNSTAILGIPLPFRPTSTENVGQQIYLKKASKQGPRLPWVKAQNYLTLRDRILMAIYRNQSICETERCTTCKRWHGNTTGVCNECTEKQKVRRRSDNKSTSVWYIWPARDSSMSFAYIDTSGRGAAVRVPFLSVHVSKLRTRKKILVWLKIIPSLRSARCPDFVNTGSESEPDSLQVSECL